MSGNYPQSKQKLSFNNEFKLNLLKLTTFWLTYISHWLFKVSSRSSNACIEASAPLVIGFVNNAVLHFSSHINQTLPQIIHILHCLSGRLVAELCPRFCSQLNWGQGCSAATNLEWWMQTFHVHCLACSVRWSTVLLNDEEIAWDLTYAGQQLLC